MCSFGKTLILTFKMKRKCVSFAAIFHSYPSIPRIFELKQNAMKKLTILLLFSITLFTISYFLITLSTLIRVIELVSPVCPSEYKPSGDRTRWHTDTDTISTLCNHCALSECICMSDWFIKKQVVLMKKCRPLLRLFKILWKFLSANSEVPIDMVFWRGFSSFITDILQL